MAAKLKEMAKMAFKRLSTGFWQDEKNKRKKTLAILQNKGVDTTAAKEYFVSSTKQQINSEYNKEDEEMYLRVKNVFLSGNTENALSVLIDQEKIKTMDDNSRQRYIFNLSAKLQEFRERFEKEQKYDYQAMSL